MSMNDYEILRNYAEVGTVLCPYNCLCVCTCQIACMCVPCAAGDWGAGVEE